MKIKKYLLKTITLILLLMGAISACSPEFDAEIADLDTAISWTDQDQDFALLKTFFLYDTVVHIITDSTSDKEPKRKFDQQIIDDVRYHLKRLGWEEIEEPSETNKPDASILISVLYSEINYYYYYWPDYWYWYPWYYWDPSWTYPVYPVYPPDYAPAYSYSVGTLNIDMVNVDELKINMMSDPPLAKIPIVWTGSINGLLTGSDQYISGRIEKQIGQVFNQSKALSKN